MGDNEQRGHRACMECRRKKTKCDMRQPICGLCQRIGGSCTFPSKRKTPEFRNRVHKTSQTSYKNRFERLMALLESKLDDEQDLHATQSPGSASSGHSESANAGIESAERPSIDTFNQAA